MVKSDDAGKNPILDDLTFNKSLQTTMDITPRPDPMQALARAIETILSENNIEQKTKISGVNETGLIQCESLIEFIKLKYGMPSKVLTTLCRQKRLNAMSVGGWRAEQIVKIFESVKSEYVTADIPQSRRFFGAGK